MATRGRPSKYKPEYAAQALKYCLIFGATEEKLAEVFDVTISSIQRWLAKYPEFRTAVKKGGEEADAQVVRSLFQRATGYKHKAVKIFQHRGRIIEQEYTERYPPDPVACIFWLKNRQRQSWRDRPAAESSDNRLDEVLELAKNGPAETNPESDKA